MEEQTVTIEKIVHGGKGLGRINGQVVFVPLTLPGETVRVQITKNIVIILKVRSLKS